jgi:hypothetical protein
MPKHGNIAGLPKPLSVDDFRRISKFVVTVM